jgi:TatD DNase family protein
MIDTHCHIDSQRFDGDRQAVLQRAREAAVRELIVPTVGPGSWEPMRVWAAGRSGVHFALGIHPQLLPDLSPETDAASLEDLQAQLLRGGAIAIGECGLDGPSATGAPMSRQVEILRAHLKLAQRFGLPVLLHCLHAHEPMMALLAHEPLPAGGVLHSFSGAAEQVREYLRFNLHFSFAGPITYERAKKPVLAARAVPRDRLLVETDAPDQTPRPFEGRCEPAHLKRVVEGLATALGEPLEEVAALTEKNARALFRIQVGADLTG